MRVNILSGKKRSKRKAPHIFIPPWIQRAKKRETASINPLPHGFPGKNALPLPPERDSSIGKTRRKSLRAFRQNCRKRWPEWLSCGGRLPRERKHCQGLPLQKKPKNGLLNPNHNGPNHHPGANHHPGPCPPPNHNHNSPNRTNKQTVHRTKPRSNARRLIACGEKQTDAVKNGM